MNRLETACLSNEIIDEVMRARSLYAPMCSTHEGIAVIREEYLELEKEVFKKQTEYDRKAMRKESIHLAAMAMRFVLDLLTDK